MFVIEANGTPGPNGYSLGFHQQEQHFMIKGLWAVAKEFKDALLHIEIVNCR